MINICIDSDRLTELLYELCWRYFDSLLDASGVVKLFFMIHNVIQLDWIDF